MSRSALHGTPALLLCLLAAPGGERLAPHARAGDRTRFTFSQALHLVMQEQQDVLLVDGEEHAASPGPRAGFVVEERERAVFVDLVLAAEDGAPVALERTFEHLSSRSTQTVETEAGRDRVRDGVGQSPLEGRRVRFARDPRTGALRAAWADDGGPGRGDAGGDDQDQDEHADPDAARAAALLPGLEARCDLSWLLPPEPVELDQTWELPAAALRRLSYPGGELGVRIAGDARGGAFGAAFHEHLTGRITGRYLGRREVEGRALAVVGLSAELTTAFALPRGDGPLLRYEFELELDGELTWDPAAGCAVALDWRGPARARTETLRPGAELALLTRQRFEGTLAFEVAVE